MNVSWPFYLSECMSPRWKPLDPCVEYWTELSTSIVPETLTFAEFQDFATNISDVLLSHLQNLTLETSVVPLVVIIWSPHILTSVAVHAVAIARLPFLSVSKETISLLLDLKDHVLAIIDLSKLEHPTSLYDEFFIYLDESSERVFTKYDWHLLLRKTSSSWSSMFIKNGDNAFSHLAYVVTSSGTSGGKRKLAFISDACFTANISDLCSRFGYSNLNRGSVLLTAPLTFDPSLIQIYFALATCRCLVLSSSGLLCHPESMMFFCSNAHIDWLHCTPSLFMLQSQRCQTEMLRNPELTIVLGGEPFPSKLFSSSNYADAGLYSIYGVTELSCWASLCKVGGRPNSKKNNDIQCCCKPPAPGLTPIGFPMFATKIELLPKEGKFEVVLSRGDAGFYVLHKTGSFVEAKDFQRSILMLQSPAPWPTGDLALLGSCGKCLWFAGRTDRSVKRFGRVICLEALEGAICDCKFSWISLVYCRCKLFSLRSGTNLMAFVWFRMRSSNWNSRRHVYITQYLRTAIVRHLRRFFAPNSEAWIPTKFVFREGSPALSVHGKVHRLVSAKIPLKKNNVLSVLYSLLTEHGIDAKSNKTFFDLGGSSLMATYFLDSLLRNVSELAVRKSDLLSKLFSLSMIRFTRFVASCLQSPLVKPTVNRVRTVGSLNFIECVGSQLTVPVWFRQSKVFTSGTVQQHASLKTPNCLINLWTKPFGKCIDASAVVFSSSSIASPFVCIGSHSGQFSAVDLRSGVFKWSVNVDERIESAATIGFNSSDPVVVVGTLTGHLHCMELGSGGHLWSFNVGGAIKSAPLFLSHRSLFVLGSHGRNVIAIDPRIPFNSIWINDFDSSPIVAAVSPLDLNDNQDQIFVASLGGTVGCIDLRAPKKALWLNSGLPPVFAGLTVCRNHLENPCVVATFVDSSVRCYSSITGNQVWSLPRLCDQSNVFKTALAPSAHNDLLIPTSNGRLYSVNVSSGDCIWWQSFTDNLLEGEPSLLNTPSLIYDADKQCNRLVTLGRADGWLYVCSYEDITINRTNNSITPLTTTKLPGHCFSNPVFFSSNEFNNCFLITGCRDDHLYCFSLIHN